VRLACHVVIALALCACRAVAGVGGDLCILEPGTPATATCRLTPPQCGCPEGQACVQGTTARACVPAGDVPIGQVCGDLSDCAPGASCGRYGSTGICSQFCIGDDDCPPSSRCLLSVGPGANICSLPCDPARASERCGTGTCDLFGGVLACRDVGPGGRASSCASNLDCGAGLHCQVELGTFTCDILCGPGVACPSGEYCQRFTSFDPVGPGEWGDCGPALGS
jgi:hypothetical protein